MVVIVIGDASARVTAIGRALAAEMNCRFVNEHDSSEPTTLTHVGDSRSLASRERSQWLRLFRSTIASAIDRREHLVVACPMLTYADRQALWSGLGRIRFVSLQQAMPESFAANEVVFADMTWPIERIIGVIRDEFGL